MKLPEIREAVIVEGRYDKNTVSQVISAMIIETNGFGIFNDAQKREFIAQMAQTRGIIILTDSDASGFLIRNKLRSFIPDEYIKNAYIPDIYGKEKRKRAPGKEGKLGVEGMRPEVIISALKLAGATFTDAEDPSPVEEHITVADLYAAGLTGRPDSAKRRGELLRALRLPEHLSTKSLCAVLDRMVGREEFLSLFVNDDPSQEEVP